MTIGSAFAISSLIRLIISSMKKISSSKKLVKVAIVSELKYKNVIELQISEYGFDNLFDFYGFFVSDTYEFSEIPNSKKILGNLDYLTKNLSELKVDEILIFDENKNSEKYNDLFLKTLDKKVRIHYLKNIEEYLVSKTINEVTKSQSILINHKLILPRFKFAKRMVDIVISLFMLTFGIPYTLIKNRRDNKYLNSMLNVFKGNQSLIGIYPGKNIRNYNAKPGILSLVSISGEDKTNPEIIRKLNDYYEHNYSISLDFDIFIKSIFKWGESCKCSTSKNQ